MSSCTPIPKPSKIENFKDHTPKIRGRVRLGTPGTIYRILSRPPRPQPPKSLRKSGKVSRVWKNSGKVLFGTSSRLFPDSSDIFQTFSRISRGSGRLYPDFVGVSGPEGSKDSCKWSTGSQELGEAFASLSLSLFIFVGDH